MNLRGHSYCMCTHVTVKANPYGMDLTRRIERMNDRVRDEVECLRYG